MSNKCQLIYLLGFMGAGKSSFGKNLAKKLGWQFLDLDEFLEASFQTSITEIFAKEGENSFREKERQVLGETFKMENTVVALGGGTPCYFDNMEQINACGLSVFFDLPQSILLGRLRQGKVQRPLIRSLGDEELDTFIKDEIKTRRPFYERAHLTVRHNDREAEKEILACLKKGN